MVNLGIHLVRFIITVEMFLWVGLWGWFHMGVTEMERSTMNVGSISHFLKVGALWPYTPTITSFLFGWVWAKINLPFFNLLCLVVLFTATRKETNTSMSLKILDILYHFALKIRNSSLLDKISNSAYETFLGDTFMYMFNV